MLFVQKMGGRGSAEKKPEHWTIENRTHSACGSLLYPRREINKPLSRWCGALRKYQSRLRICYRHFTVGMDILVEIFGEIITSGYKIRHQGFCRRLWASQWPSVGRACVIRIFWPCPAESRMRAVAQVLRHAGKQFLPWRIEKRLGACDVLQGKHLFCQKRSRVMTRGVSTTTVASSNDLDVRRFRGPGGRRRLARPPAPAAAGTAGDPARPVWRRAGARAWRARCPDGLPRRGLSAPGPGR